MEVAAFLFGAISAIAGVITLFAKTDTLLRKIHGVLIEIRDEARQRSQ